MTKNFEFLEDLKFDERDEVISIINSLEAEAEKEVADPKTVSLFRHIYLILLKMYCKYSKMDKSLVNAGDKEQWFAITKFAKDNEIACFKRIKDAGNIGSHRDTTMTAQYDFFHYLKSLHLLLRKLLSSFFDSFTDTEIQFNTTCYTGGVDKHKTAISKKEIEHWENESSKCGSTFNVQRMPIVRLLTEASHGFDIPLYQRGYSWDEDNISVLLQDIEKRQKDDLTHYFGVIAFKMIPAPIFQAKKTLSILDGQQRLTTTAILLCAVRDALKSKGYQKENFIVVEDKFRNPAGSEIDNKAFSLICQGKLDQLNRQQQNTNYFRNYIRIFEYLSNKKSDEIINFYNAFKENFSVGGIEFSSISKKTEMEIFENLNSKGKSLTLLDLTKNFLFNQCSEDTLLRKEHEITRNYNQWIVQAFNIPKDKLETILRSFFESLIHYATGEQLVKSKSNKEPDAVKYLQQLDITLQRLYMIYYRELMPKNMDINSYVKLLMMLNRYLTIYLDLFDPDNYGSFTSKKLDIQNIYKLVTQTKKKNPLYPAIYLLFDSFELENDESESDEKIIKINKKFIRKAVYEIVKTLIWHDIISGQGDSETARQFWSISYDAWAKDESKKLDPHARMNRFIDTLKAEVAKDAGDWKTELSNVSRPSWAHKALLILIEWELLGGVDRQISLEYDKPSWEHIMPQKYKNWLIDLRKWNKEWSDDEIAENHRNYVHKLGNAMRLPRGINSQLSNYSFMLKKSKINEQTEFISPLFKNSNSKIDVSKKEKWNFSDIDARHSALIKIIEDKIFK